MIARTIVSIIVCVNIELDRLALLKTTGGQSDASRRSFGNIHKDIWLAGEQIPEAAWVAWVKES